MTRECRLCLVRHGETAWNRERRLQGHQDIPLNETGHLQARATAGALRGSRFAALYSSDLTRARQTAQILADAVGLAPICVEPLRERHYGIFQGLTYDEARERFPTEYARFVERDPVFAFAGEGESLSTFAERIARALESIAQAHPGEQVLIVTHGGVLDIAHRLARAMSLDAPRDFTIPNAALNWIALDEGHWRLTRWADQDHLAGARDELPHA